MEEKKVRRTAMETKAIGISGILTILMAIGIIFLLNGAGDGVETIIIPATGQMIVGAATSLAAWNLRKKTDSKMRELEGNLERTGKEFLPGVRKSAEQLYNSCENMEYRIHSSWENVISFSAAMEEISTGTGEISSVAEDILKQTCNVQGNVEVMNTEMAKGNEFAGSIQERAHIIKSKTVRSMQRTTEVVEAMKSSLERNIEESKKIEKISNLTESILEIAEQTNLLALNATIEAARAGESGRGFSVVAEEIGKLADNSRNNANAIQVLNSQITDTVNSLLESSREMLDFLTGDLSEDYKGFTMLSERYTADADEVGSMMLHIGDMVSEIEQKMKGLSERVNDITVSMNEKEQGMRTAAKNLADMKELFTGMMEETDTGKRCAMTMIEAGEQFAATVD